MNKTIARDKINRMAQEFFVVNRDDEKQDVINQLGIHPVNHACFIDALVSFCGGQDTITYSYAFASYLDCVKTLGV